MMLRTLYDVLEDFIILMFSALYWLLMLLLKLLVMFLGVFPLLELLSYYFCFAGVVFFLILYECYFCAECVVFTLFPAVKLIYNHRM